MPIFPLQLISQVSQCHIKLFRLPFPLPLLYISSSPIYDPRLVCEKRHSGFPALRLAVCSKYPQTQQLKFQARSSIPFHHVDRTYKARLRS